MAGATISQITIVPNEIPEDAGGTVLPAEFGGSKQYFYPALALALQDAALAERTIPERAASNQRQVEELRRLSWKVTQGFERTKELGRDNAKETPRISFRKNPPYFAKNDESVNERQRHEESGGHFQRGFSRVVAPGDYQRSSSIQYQLLYAGYRDFISHHANIDLLERTAPFYEDTFRVANGALEPIAEGDRKRWDFENIPTFIPEEDRRSFAIFCREVQACAYWKAYEQHDLRGIVPEKRTLEKSFLISFRNTEEARELYEELAEYDGLFAEFSGNAAYIEELKFSIYDLAFFESFLKILEPRLQERYAHHVGGNPDDVVVGEYTQCCVYVDDGVSSQLQMREGLPAADDTVLIAGVLDHLWLLSGAEIKQILSDLSRRFPDVRFAAVDSGSTRRRALFSSRISKTERTNSVEEQQMVEPSLGEQLESDVQSHRGTVGAFIRQTGERTLRFLDRFPGQRLDERLPTPQMEVPENSTTRSVTSAHRPSFLMPVGPAASQWPIDKLKYEILLSKVKDRLLYQILLPFADELIRDTKAGLIRPGDVSSVSSAALHDILALFSLPGSGVVSPQLLGPGERGAALRERAVDLQQRVWSDPDLISALRSLNGKGARHIDPERFEVLNHELLRGQTLNDHVKSILFPSQVKLHDFVSGLCFSFEPYLKQYIREHTQDEWEEFRLSDRRDGVSSLLSLRDPLTVTGEATTPQQEVQEMLQYWRNVVTLYQTIVTVAEQGCTEDEATLLDLAVRLDEAVGPFFERANLTSGSFNRQRFLEQFIIIDQANVLVPRFKATEVDLLLAELREYTRRNGQRVASAFVDSLIIDGNSAPLSTQHSLEKLAEILLNVGPEDVLPPDVEQAFYRALSFPPEVLEFQSPLLCALRDSLKPQKIDGYDPTLLWNQKLLGDDLVQHLRSLPRSAPTVMLAPYLRDAPAVHADFGRVFLKTKFALLREQHQVGIKTHGEQFAEELAEELAHSNIDMSNLNACKVLDSLGLVLNGMITRGVAYKVVISDYTKTTKDAKDLRAMLTQLTGAVLERWQQMKGVRVAIYNLLSNAPFQEFAEQFNNIVRIVEGQPFPETVDPKHLALLVQRSATDLNDIMCRGLPQTGLRQDHNLEAFAPERDGIVVQYTSNREPDAAFVPNVARHLISVESQMTEALEEFDKLSSGSPFWNDFRLHITEAIELLRTQDEALPANLTLPHVLKMAETVKFLYGEGWAIWEGVFTVAKSDIHNPAILEFSQEQSERFQRMLTDAFVDSLTIYDPTTYDSAGRPTSGAFKSLCRKFIRTLQTTERLVAKMAKPAELSKR